MAVYTEHISSAEKKKSKDKKKRIDICLVETFLDAKQDTKQKKGNVILIENKYGSKLDPKQLQNYEKIYGKEFQGYDIIPILVDPSYDPSKPPQNSANWNFTDYEWLVDSLKAGVSWDHIDSQTKRVFSDILLELNQCYHEDIRYMDSYAAIKILAKKHPQLVKEIETISKIKDPRSHDYHLYKMYWPILDEMLSYSYFEEIAGFVKRSEKNIAVDDDYNDEVYFTTKELSSICIERQDIDWPLYVCLYKEEEKREDGEKQIEHFVMLHFHLSDLEAFLEGIDNKGKLVEDIVKIARKNIENKGNSKQFTVSKSKVEDIKQIEVVCSMVQKIFRENRKLFKMLEATCQSV